MLSVCAVNLVLTASLVQSYLKNRSLKLEAADRTALIYRLVSKLYEAKFVGYSKPMPLPQYSFQVLV